MAKCKAVPVKTLFNADGTVARMIDGPCLFCNEWVEVGREEAGSTNPLDAAWRTKSGDYGCRRSPESNDEGSGDHFRPYDAARLLLTQKTT